MSTHDRHRDDTPGPRNAVASASTEPPLPTPLRVVLYFAGWFLLLVGLLGLALPGIQGVLTLILGAAVLSLASEATHRWLRRLLRPWPKGAQRFEQARTRLHQWLSRFHRRS